MVEALNAADRRPAARAFTLVEMLVVIAIVLLLMGLSVASVVRGPRLQRMIAAEQVVADCIRQARHTARTSGQPVVLKLKKEERSISGLVRTVLWHGVEGWPLRDNGSDPDIAAPGRTGSGLAVPDCFQQQDDRLLGTMDPAPVLTGGQRLWRGQADPDGRPGLLLSVAVRPPIAGTVPGSIIPLALVGEDLSTGYASCEASSLGLALILSDTVADALKPGTARRTVAKSWEIVGWFGADEAGRIEVSSIANPPPDQSGVVVHRQDLTIVRGAAGGDVRGDAEAGPLVGGRWTEISLLVDGPRLVLYRDGRRVGERGGAATVALPDPTAERVYVGHMRLDGSGIDAIDAQLDDVRLERLGDAMAGTLPGGVIPKLERRIVCHPDGRVEVDADGATAMADATIVLGSDSGEEATLTVTTAGAVTSRTAAAP